MLKVRKLNLKTDDMYIVGNLIYDIDPYIYPSLV